MPDDSREGVANKRVERRVSASLPVTLENVPDAVAVTRDVSASGIFFETDATLEIDSLVNLEIEIETSGGRRVLKCQGAIVRLEKVENRLGCGVKILSSLLVHPE